MYGDMGKGLRELLTVVGVIGFFLGVLAYLALRYLWLHIDIAVRWVA